MKFKLIIDKEQEESLIATVHERNDLIRQIEDLLQAYSGEDRIPGYQDDTIKMLHIGQIQCITVIEGKTYAIDDENQTYRLKKRLYEFEQALPAGFVRINKSTLAKLNAIDRFAVNFSGGVDAIFKCGYTEYVSRRCFAQLKRRIEGK